MKKVIYVFILFVVSLWQVSAQSGSRMAATVSGRVTDGSTQDPMAAATVSVKDRETGSIVTGALTNAEGEFEIPNIPFGEYDLGISFIGYEDAQVEGVTVNEQQTEVSIGTIVLSPSDVTLGEVNVVSERPVIENRSDKIIYNVSSDVASQGTLAIDVLRKVPQVTVDADGNVELQGNSNIRFLINGKESSIFGNNLADALASIPASQIKSIEAITNPGAKYDLQGTGGVINIILQENRFEGASGNFNLSAGTRSQTGSVSLGIKEGNFGVNGYFSGNWRLGTDGAFSATRETFDTLTGQSTSLVQDGLSRFERNGYRGGAGFEWEITDRLNLAGTVGYNNFMFGSSGIVDLNNTILDNTGTLISGLSTVRNFTNDRETGALDWNLSMKKTFAKEGHELDVVLNSNNGRPVSSYLLTLSDVADAFPSEGSESRNPGTDNTTTASVDYVHPFTNTTTLEAGLKSTFNNITSSVSVNVYNPVSNTYVFDPLQSYDLGYTLNVYAAYLSVGFRIFDLLDIKPGARYEYSDISIDFPGASVPSYGTLVPSMLVSYNFAENKSLQLTYSRRIRRPDYGDLNPFINRSDPYNIETGNVLLKPEVGDRIELGYNTGFSKGGNLRITLSQRIDSREIDDLTTFYPVYTIGDSVYRNVSVTTNVNIGSEYNTGINVFTSVPITPKFSLRGNFMLFHTYLETADREEPFSTGFRFRGNMNATWQLPSKFVAELFGFFRSGGKDLQGRQPQFYIYNFALRKMFWNDNASFGLTATNVLQKNIRQVRTITTENSVSRNVREIPFRSFGVSFTYKFGKMQSRERDRDNTDVEPFGGGNGE